MLNVEKPVIQETTGAVDVVLLQLPFWGVGCPPLAHALLKSYLTEHGISCKVFDINAHCYAVRGWDYAEHWHLKNGYNFSMERDSMLAFYRDNRALMLYYMNQIKQLNPLIVGCSVQNTSRILSELFLEDLRQNVPEPKLIMGGPEVAHFMKNSDSLLSREYVDGVCQDEGEAALLAYVNAVKADDGRQVPGMVYKRNGEIIHGSASEYIGKLDTLPIGEFSDFRQKNYHVTDALPTYSSRGCVNKCNYCSAIGFMTNDRWRFRLRSAEKMFEEFVQLTTLHPETKHFRMCDNISNAKISSLEKFCDLMIESGMNKKVTWTLENAVIRKEMRKPLYKKLKKAGCTLLGYGMETPSVPLLRDVGKTLATKNGVDLPAILKEGKDAGLVVSVNVMFGLPTETEADFEFLMEFLSENKNAFSMVNPSLNFCEYYPGSAGHENPTEHGIDLTDGPLFWRSLDGNSDYLKRMERFEVFCRRAREFKIENLFDVDELPNKHKLLFDYYFAIKEFDKCADQYEQIREGELTEEISLKQKAIETGDFSILEVLDSDTLHLEDYVKTKGSFEKTIAEESLENYLKGVLNRDVSNNSKTLNGRLLMVRRLGHTLMGYKALDRLINDVLELIQNMEEEYSKKEGMVVHQKEVIRDKMVLMESIIKSAEENLNSKRYKTLSLLFGVNNYFALIRKVVGILGLLPDITLPQDRYSGLIQTRGAKIHDELNEVERGIYSVTLGKLATSKLFVISQALERLTMTWKRIIGMRAIDHRMIALYTAVCLLIMKFESRSMPGLHIDSIPENLKSQSKQASIKDRVYLES